jgi:deoxycytidine triphosphate deaminase
LSILGLNDLIHLNGLQFSIFPEDGNCFTPLGYDLRVGCQIILPEFGSKANLSASKSNKVEMKTAANGEFVFPPKSTSIVVTRERVWLSRLLAGTIQARGSLALRGLVISATTVDPNWDGQMFMRIYNSSPSQESIGPNEAFCTMMLHTLASPSPNPPNTNPARAVDNLKAIYGESIGAALYSYTNTTSAIKERNQADLLIHKAKVHSGRNAAVRKLIQTSIIWSKKLQGKIAARGMGVISISLFIAVGLPFVINHFLNGKLFDLTSPVAIYFGLAFTIFFGMLAVPSLFSRK